MLNRTVEGPWPHVAAAALPPCSRTFSSLEQAQPIQVACEVMLGQGSDLADAIMAYEEIARSSESQQLFAP